MPTLFTDPRSGGIKKSSGVNVLPIVQETWAEVRDDSNTEVDWLIAGYHGNSKTEITVLTKGRGGLASCANVLPSAIPVFGGVRLSRGRFVTFFHADEGTSVMKKGRASMHKNGVLNVLQGSDCEIEIWPGMTEDDVGKSQQDSSVNNGIAGIDTSTSSKSFDEDNIEKIEEATSFPRDGDNGAASGRAESETNAKRFNHIERSIKTHDINVIGGNQHRNLNIHNKNPNATATGTEPQYKPSLYSNPKPTSSFQSSSPEQTSQNEKDPLDHKQIYDNEPPDVVNEEREVNIVQSHIPYVELKGITNVSELPEGVDPVNREASLSDEEFHEVFGMNKEAFYKLPSWKRVKHKKEKLLF